MDKGDQTDLDPLRHLGPTESRIAAIAVLSASMTASQRERSERVVQSAFPIISTPDLSRALAFYGDLLGGAVGYQFPPEGEPQYVGMDLGSSHIGIGVDPKIGDEASQQRFSLWVYVDDCDSVVDSLRVAKTPILDEPTDQPWGERIARVSDPDGNVVIIGSRLG